MGKQTEWFYFILGSLIGFIVGVLFQYYIGGMS